MLKSNPKFNNGKEREQRCFREIGQGENVRRPSAEMQFNYKIYPELHPLCRDYAGVQKDTGGRE